MKTLIISLLLFFFILSNAEGTVQAQNVWYVDRDATGANNGRSWTNAWNTLDSSAWLGNQGINWAIVGDGDTIYVSGGTDSTRYVPLSNNLYNGVRREASLSEVIPTFNQTVIVTRAWHPNHNGDVYFTPKDDDTYSIFILSGVNNVKFTEFNFVETRSNNTTKNNGLIYMVSNDNSIENSRVYSRGLTGGLNFEGNRLSFSNNIYEFEENALDNELDPLTGFGGDGNYTLDGNTVITKNTSLTTDAHRDMVQIAHIGNHDQVVGSYADIVIKNNLLIVDKPGAYWNSIIYASIQYKNINYYIYNNVFVSRNTVGSMGNLFIYNSNFPTWANKYYVFNNTFIMSGDSVAGTGGAPYTLSRMDTLIVKNNISVNDVPPNLIYAIRTFYDGAYFRQIDYNGYFKSGGFDSTVRNFYIGDGFNMYSYNEWRSIYPAYDANSLTGNSTDVVFNNRYAETIDGYYTTTGRDLGQDLSVAYPDLVAKFPDIAYDILGNPRGSNGAWDMGALEFQGSQSNSINLKSKIYLQGPFSSDVMLTNLSQSSLLPVSQPFNSSPWNYTGSERLGSGSVTSYVDWVLVELRSSSSPTQVISRRAAILNNIGLLLDTDGTQGVKFYNVPEGTYYIVVLQRNHLSIMSANPVVISANTPIYDFTSAMNKAYGENPMVEVAAGKFGMYAGDGNGNGGISISDRNEVWQPQNGSVGYLNGDFNLDGGVTIRDINLYWNLNNGKVSQVP